jgi:hypothetical protein
VSALSQQLNAAPEHSFSQHPPRLGMKQSPSASRPAVQHVTNAAAAHGGQKNAEPSALETQAPSALNTVLRHDSQAGLSFDKTFSCW